MATKKMMKKPLAKKQNGGSNSTVVPVPGMKKSQAKAEEFYDKNPSVRTYTNEYTGKTIPTGPMTKKEYQEAAQRAADVYDDKPTPMRKKGGAMTSTKKTTYKSGGATKMKTMKKYQDGGIKSAAKKAVKKSNTGYKPNDRQQVSANGKIRTTTTNEKGQRDYIHTGSAKDGNFTGKGDKYYTAGKMNAQIGKPGKVEYSQDNYSKDVDTTGYSAGKKQFTVNTNITKPGGKTSTTSKTINRSQVKPMLDRMKSTASKMKTGGMVNPNTNLQAGKKAGSKGVKSGVNPKAAASNTAKKPSKPRSKAPKKATPGRG
jgi:hypothetical protein